MESVWLLYNFLKAFVQNLMSCMYIIDPVRVRENCTFMCTSSRFLDSTLKKGKLKFPFFKTQKLIWDWRNTETHVLKRQNKILLNTVQLVRLFIFIFCLQLWQFLTKAPVFSSPSFLPGQQRLLCGSHDGRLYCLNCADGSSVWTFQTSGKVYSTACVFEGSAAGHWGALVALASTDGTVWILDAQDGRVLASHALPGELFSSPVVWERSLVIGCRNDYVYCLNLAVIV